MTTVIEGIAGLKALVGTHLGYSDYLEITQERVNTFADATGDHQWIHVDPERAVKGPFGTTIAHGYLTLSLLPVLLSQAYEVHNLAMGMNYGANKVRFPSPVPVDARVRATATLLETKPISIGTQVVIAVRIEREGGDKPALVAEVVYVMAGN